MEEERLHRLSNRLFIITIILTVAIGLIMVFSASSIRIPQSKTSIYHYFLKQAFWTVIGFLGMLLVARINCNWVFKNSKYILVFCLFLTALTQCFPPINNSRRWLILGPLNIQPSEILKISFILYLSSFFSKKNGDKLGSFFYGILPPTIVLTAIIIVLSFQPHCGMAVFISLIFLFMVFLGRVKIRHFLFLFIFVFVVIGTIIATKNHAIKRIIDRDSYQIRQAEIALGNGGFFGKGPGGSQQKLFTLPLPYTDFILAIIGEEYGFFSGILVITGLFVLFAITGFSISIGIPSTFGFLLVFGLTLSISLQVIINMAVVSNLLPIAGLPLPFISYGGSSLVSNLISIGLIINISHSFSKTKHHFSLNFLLKG